jgi:hypothetical protein
MAGADALTYRTATGAGGPRNFRRIAVAVRLPLPCACLSLAVLLGTGPAAAGPTGARELAISPLFVPAAPAARLPHTEDPTVVRERLVVVDLATIAPRAAAAPSMDQLPADLFLNLFDDAAFLVTRIRGEVRSPSSYTWCGRIAGDDRSLVVLAGEHGVMMGSVSLFGHNTFRIRYAGGGHHVIAEVEFPRTRSCGIAAVPEDFDGHPGFALSAAAGAVAPAATADSEIDILVAYTAAARVGAGGTDAIRALSALAMGETNAALLNSQAGAQLRLVQCVEVSYAESGSSPTDLARLANRADGTMDEIHSIRDAYGADLVSLLTHTGDYLGYAYITATPQTAFSVVGWGSATAPAYIFAHEVGHNLGAGHARPVGPAGKFDYSYGYWDQHDPSAWRTIVAQYGGELIPYYSNPRVAFNGQPTGVDASDVANSADNARTVSLHASLVSNFRTAVVGTDPSVHSGRSASPFTLWPNHPNPCNPRTVIPYVLRSREHVDLTILDVRGRRVRRLVGAVQDAGRYSPIWDGFDDDGVAAPSGAYLYRIAVGGLAQSRRLVLLR